MSWPLTALGEIVTIKGGGTPSKSQEAFWGGDIPWASVKDLKGSRISTTQDSITEMGVKNSATNVIPAGTILTATRMALGRFAINTVDMAINQDLKALFINDLAVVDRDYLFRFLESKSQLIDSEGKGATVKGITLDFLKSIQTPLPPLSEQKRIAAILDKADAIRRKRQQAIQLADDFIRSVFLEMFGDPVINSKGWEIKLLSDLIAKGDKLNYGVVQPGENVEDGIPLIRSGDLYDIGTDINSIRKVSATVDEKHKKSRLKGNEILIACVGSIGKVGWVNESMIGWNIARAVTRIPLSKDVNREYVYRYLQSPVIQGYFLRETRAVAQPTLNVGLIGKTPIALPPKELQEEFLKVFSVVNRMKHRFSQQSESGADIFNSISQRAFAGEL